MSAKFPRGGGEPGPFSARSLDLLVQNIDSDQLFDNRAAYLCLHFDCMESTATKNRLCCVMAHMNKTSELKT